MSDKGIMPACMLPDGATACDAYIRLHKRALVLEDKLKWAYCEKKGSDSIVGLDCCDNYKDWLLKLTS
jgi:hypothetical protein